MTDELFAMIADERTTLAGELEGLDAAQWATPSLCRGWTVRDVAGHLTVPFHTSTPKLLVSIAASGFSFNRAMDKLSRARAAATEPAALAADLRANAGHQFKPPGAGAIAPLTDIVVHGQDIRRPLGSRHTIDPDRALRIMGFLTSGRTFGFVPKGRLNGLRFEATDADWSYGDGATVRGTIEALMMTITGRAAALDDCTGDGVETLRDRVR